MVLKEQFNAIKYGDPQWLDLVNADHWYPSSRLFSVCDWKNEALTLKDPEWLCLKCGAHLRELS